MRSQRSGVRRIRRSDGTPLPLEVLRGHAVGRDHEVLDELLGPVLLVGQEVGQHVAVEEGSRSRSFRGSARPAGAGDSSSPARRGLARAGARRARAPRRAARAAAPSRRARRRRCCRRASRDSARRARYTSESLTAPSAPTTISMTIARRSLAFAERRQVGRELLGQHREDLGGRVDRTSCWSARARRSPSPCFTVASTSATATRIFTAPPAMRLGDGELVEIARVVVVDRAQRRPVRSLIAGPDSEARLRDGVGLRLGRRREIRLEPALGHHAARDRLKLFTVLGRWPAHLFGTEYDARGA